LAAKPQDEPGAAAGEDFSRLPAEIVFRRLRSRNLFEETVARLGQAIKLGEPAAA
jgi:hypothetical protein